MHTFFGTSPHFLRLDMRRRRKPQKLVYRSGGKGRRKRTKWVNRS